MDDRSKLVKSLSADELRRLMEKLRKKGPGAVERIGRAPRDGGPLPLSFAQERLWFLEHLGAGAAGVYNVPAAVRLTGRLGVPALRRTFEEIVHRHEALRTTFGERDGVPFQVVAPPAAVPLPVTDLSALPAAAREREMLRLATAEAARPFDLRRGPLFRAALVRLGDEEHVLALTIHHIVSDGWSAGVLIREMAALYDAFCAGRPATLPELPIQYADYAVWQRERMRGEALEKEIAFWRERLAGTPPLELPTDRPRPAVASPHGGHRAAEIAAEVLPRVNALAREAEGTLYMVLLAAFETLLLRYSGQEDFAVGAPVANRNRSETEGLIGFFVNTLALRSSLAAGLAFRGLLGRVKERTLAAFAHEDMPFDKLVEELQPEREAGRNPIFQVVLTLQNQPRPALAMGGLALAAVGVETGTAKFDLTFSWSEEEGRLWGSIEHSAALFDGATAERLGRHFGTLLAGAAANPGLNLWELPLLDAAERRQTLVEWNRTALAYPSETPVHELFEQWVKRTPEAVAVEFGDDRLTYAELNARANRLAHRLRRLGVGPEELVVLAIPRSLEMIEGMMGILKAGGAYLPLDPTQPRDRLAFLVEESRPAALVTLEEHLAALPEFGERGVCLDRDRASLEGEPAENPRGGILADNLVYVLYTSGSTGRPKAVAVPHRGLVRLVAGADYARLDAGETFFQLAPLSFDPSTLEIFGALVNGGRLAVAPTGPFSLAELGHIIRRHGVTTLWLTSGLFHQMIEEGLDDLRGVRQLLSGGDVLSPPHIRRALEALPDVELIDGYGPTENSCFTTCYRVDRNDPPGAYVPIGKPMANTTVYILDREMRPVPVGVPGELLTGGDGLARGYRGRPELTAERFVPSPFAGELDPPGARLYRTGDLARFRPDGNVEFLGRMDNQVKIRGYRIEPGEVETVLSEHPALAECAVVVRREESGEKRLVAFYVPSAPVTTAGLKEHLGASLPAYMIPSAFVEMAELPLTVSGKVDRRTLSRLEAPAGEGPSDAYAEPRTDVERRIAAIWSDLLGRERIGRNDSFFDLGGHSLLATRVLSRLRESLRADLSLAVVFERPTLAGLAEAVEEALGSRPAEGPGGADAGSDLAWWREHLSGAPLALDLPTDHPRPAVASAVSGRERLEVPGGVPGERAALLAAFAAVLSRWAGEPELLVGLPFAGGPLPLRVSLEGDPAFRELVERVREEARAAAAHPGVSLEQLAAALAPDPGRDRHPLFQVMLEPGEVEKLDLSLVLMPEGPEGEGLAGWIEYRRDLFEAATAQRLAGHLLTLLGAAAAAPGTRVSELPLLSAAERDQLLAWRRSPGVWAVPGTAHGLFEEQARLRPEAVALVSGERSLTYGELERRSGALAHALRRLGVGPEVRVGLSAERSFDLVVGILGVLRAGGALVPLDPAHPQERLELLLADSGLAVVVSQEELPASGPATLRLGEVEDADWTDLAVPEEALAYVIYTSGSTGRPKGVGVTHANLVPMLLWSRETFALGPGTRVLQSLSYAFDFGLWEILTAVTSGAALHIPPVEETGDAAAFARRALAEGIGVVHATPSFARAVAETGTRLEGLRVLHLGGEALSLTAVERLAAAVGEGCTLYNGYGPTEVTVNSLLFEIGRPGHLRGGERTPIGRPSAENAAYVVDPRGGLAPVGVPGELRVGGPGVARGYLGRPELTAERFIPDVFGEEPGGRLYRTGDLVRWLPDGTVEFLGRVDDQVKVRGFRIEPGEVEAALRRHPQVREAVVLARDERLVAWVVAGEDAPEAGELRDFLRGSLPAALVPSVFVRLAELPLTPTGKVDRRALPAPDLDAAREEAPRTPAEEVLARIFQEILGVSAVRRSDSFFDLGGHSLLATRVVARIRKELGVDVPMRVLFEDASVAGLAERLAAIAPALPAAEARAREGGLPLSFAQERLWFLEQLQPGTAAYNVPLPVRLRGPLDHAAFAAALREVARRHQVLRSTFGELDGQPAQWVSPEAVFPLPVVDLSGLPEASRAVERERLADEEAQRPFDLTRGPVARGLLLRLDRQDHVLVLTLHHIAADGWSLGILIHELLALYQAALAGSPSPLPELPRQYSDYARRQRGQLQGEALEELLAYWRQALAGLPEVLELPIDRPRPAVRSFRGGAFHFAFGPELARALNGAARESRATLFMTLLAGLGALLARYSRQDDLAVGSPIAGRNQAEHEGLIGFFVNTLVLRVEAPGDLTFHDLLGRVRKTTLGAFEHQDLPFERIVAELQPERSLAHSPLFQVSLALQNNERTPAAFSGLAVEPLETGVVAAKFDLTLALQEEPGRIAGMAEYATELFDEATVRRLVEHLENLLAAAAAAPRTPLAELPLLTPAESRQILERSAGEPLPARAAEALGRLLGTDAAGLEGFRLYILDLALQPVPLGVPGEICVGGPGLADLSLESPELAAARLVPDPFAAAPGGRLFRTGELARYRLENGAAGGVEYVERPAAAATAARPKRYVAPRTPVEKVLAALWEEALGVDRVGVHDDFFDLGGHSLLITRVAARMRAELGASLSVRQMFEASTLEGLARAVEAAGGTAAPAAAPAAEGVTRRPPGDRDLPLSFPQERLWFLDRLDPGAPFYNIALTLRLTGRLDVPALTASLNGVLRRHEALRTAFVTVEGQPRQRVLPFTPQVVPLIDLSALPPAPRGREAERVAQQYADWRFDLTRGPLLVAAILRLEPEVHHCAAVFHHIASDGWSVGLFFQEVAALYPAFLEGRPSPLPELPVQYPDYALWQRRAIAGTLEREVAYWLERLGGEIAPLELPIDRPRPAVQSYRGHSVVRDLPPALGGGLNALSRREGATLFMTLLAAAKVLFHRWSGQDDILVGAPIAGRRLVETEGLIGFFLNTLVLRTDLSGAPSFRELLERVRAVTLGAYSHQDVPFEALLARLPQQRDPSRTPLFQVMFNMLNLPVTGAVPLPGITLEPFAVPELPSKFDLTFYVTERPNHGLFVHLLYNADLFDVERMEGLMDQLTAVLEQAAAAPETPIEALSLVTPAARAVLPDPAAPLDATWVGAIHDLFSARARSAPERTAVSDREGTWSYGELETAANRLAHALLAEGVRKGDRVAVWAHRSAPVAAAVLGALKAGAAFTMLDPAYPPARLVEILRVATPRALIRLEAGGPLPDAVDAWLAEAGCARLDLPRGGAAAVLARLEGLPAEPPAVATGPDDVAVLGFTSGSTGTPKGIAGRHGPLTHFLPWQCERFGLNGEDRFSMLSGLAHDPLQRDLFTPLYLGATIVVPDPEDIGVSGRLAAWVAREGVTVAHLTPAMGQILTERPSGGAFVEAPSLRLVMLVGDALTRLDVARIRRLAPGVTCVNLYGSTETQRAVAYHVCAGTGEDAKQVLPLGAGMRDAQLLLTNRAGGLAGVSEVGEIAVRSPHLAQGYLGDEALTADKFRINPFTGLPGDRIYRTGDLGRYLPDGEVAFAGRADQQVKIRGFRIEPAEIEARLAALPGVREAVVVAREDRGEKRLVAYIVAEGGAVSPAFLRQALRDRLPAYMVPSAFVLLERLPITPNGKVDRRALPAPVEEAGEARAQAAPESPVEEQIAAVWREVLGVERVGVTDNFFDVGGHSLLLVRLHSRLQEALGREISLMELFNHPNIRSQADHLGGGRAPVAAPPVRPARAPRPLEPEEDEAPAGGIAIVGMAGRFPMARDLEAFWRNLRDGVEAISFFSDEEVAASGIHPEAIASPKFVKARGVLEDEALFDADFFDVSPRQAELMDPQLRHFLECSWEALESAGYDPARFPGQIGVYGGATTSSYFLRNLLSNPDLILDVGSYQTAIATDRDFLTTQVSYKLNLRGPSLTVQTACSTSLVAAHLACLALLAGECELALAGGVSIKVPQVTGHLYEEGGLDSSDGHCRSFDARADGSVYGGGVGVVVLKRLEDARADGDTIHAVILGSSINNDGSAKVGYTAPSIEGQSRAIAEAQAAAGIAPETIGYVECHGSGTALGDPIEVAALTRAFATSERGFCPIGAVKSSIGHLGAAAGVAGLIKTVLALEHRQVPPSLHFETPNPRIDFASSPFYVNTRLADWPAGDEPRRAGVSSFGIGGTNAHMVLEEAPPPASGDPGAPWQLLVLSARTETALDAATGRLAEWLEEHPEADLADVAHTLQVGRREFSWRRTLVCRDAAGARQALAGRDPQAPRTAWTESGGRTPVAFLLPGVGDHYPGMARGLHESEPVFRRELDRCLELLRERLGEDLREVIFAGERATGDGLDLRRMLGRGGPEDEAARRLSRTVYAQPAVFAVEYALARLWESWGVRPDALLGYSLGEYTAACLAGVFSLEDALTLVAERARWIEELPAGEMLAVSLPESAVRPRLSECLSLAATNGPQLTVVSGPAEQVAGLAERLAAEGIACRRVPATHAFHSQMMAPLAGRLTELARTLKLSPPRVPCLSNVTGTWLTAAEATDPGYWARHLCGTVRFSEALEELWKQPSRVLLEVGPGQGLSALALQHPSAGGRTALPSLPHAHEGRPDAAFLADALGRLWLAGVEVDWSGVHGGARRRRLPLPTYPFERRRFWIEADRKALVAAGSAATSGDRDRRDSWLQVPAWRRAPLPAVPAPTGAA
ncbi:MAG: amino acid adenylation domain-containing protein, partial [Thermoanaerobaculia bacterium]